MTLVCTTSNVLPSASPISRAIAGVAVAVMPRSVGCAELLERAPDEEVVGAEVVSPHAHAVHLVHDHEPDPDLGEHRDEARLPQALGCGVDETGLPGRDVGEPRRRLLGRE